jgi:hypothetical protein
MLLAEVEKSSGQVGSKAKARELLECALTVLQEATDERAGRERLRCRHDIARLTHFFDRNLPDAIKLYKSVEQDYQAIPGARLERAIALRNLAEALQDSARGAADVLAEADNRITNARDLLPPGTGHAVASELEYLAGRVAQRRGLAQKEVQRRFERCREVALATNHLMMAAIVEARLFWRADPGLDQADSFQHGVWHQRADALAQYERHAWAARTLINGRLRASRRLTKQGNKVRARTQELEPALRLIEANPAFDEGDDRRRIAAIYGGLAVLDSTRGWWTELAAKYAWAKDYAAKDPMVAWEWAG